MRVIEKVLKASLQGLWVCVCVCVSHRVWCVTAKQEVVELAELSLSCLPLGLDPY